MGSVVLLLLLLPMPAFQKFSMTVAAADVHCIPYTKYPYIACIDPTNDQTIAIQMQMNVSTRYAHTLTELQSNRSRWGMTTNFQTVTITTIHDHHIGIGIVV